MDANSEKKIKVLPNGPYEVIGDIPLNQLRYVNDRKGASTGYKEICSGRRISSVPLWRFA